MPTKKKPKHIDVASLARGYTDRCIKVLGGIVETGAEEGNRVRAAQVLLDRGWGKPAQDNTVSGELKITIRKLLDDKK